MSTKTTKTAAKAKEAVSKASDADANSNVHALEDLLELPEEVLTVSLIEKEARDTALAFLKRIVENENEHDIDRRINAANKILEYSFVV